MTINATLNPNQTLSVRLDEGDDLKYTIKKPVVEVSLNDKNGYLTNHQRDITLKNQYFVIYDSATKYLTDLYDVEGPSSPIGNSTIIYNSNANIYDVKQMDYDNLIGEPDLIDGGTF